MIGDRLGKWIIYKELGHGGMGRVYLAQEEIGGRQAAIKVLAAELAQSSGFLERFRREIETLSQLDHPHIVRFYESGFENGMHFYAMEYVEGSGLDEVLEREQRLPWKQVLDIALQICPALKHVHDHGVIHRDLKPANLLRTSTGVVKLTDFGIAKVFAHGHLTATGGVVGTAQYLSPEQAAGKHLTKRSDLYSLGAVLYVLITGRPPFVGESVLDLLHKHSYAQFDSPRKIVPQLPYELDEVICELLEKDPAKRPPDCLVLGRRLDSIRRKLDRQRDPTRDLAGEGEGENATISDHTMDVGAMGHNPGPATMMSRWVRQELGRQTQGGPLARLFSRWFIVLPLFLLVSGMLVWAYWPPSAESLYQRGAALMQSTDPADWDRAWREYLQPLQRDYPDHSHQAQVESFRQQIAARRQALEAGMPISEGQRLYQIGERLRQEGKYQEARQLWSNLEAVFQHIDSEKAWALKAHVAVTDLDKALADQKRLTPVWAALKEANALRDEGKRELAEVIWRGIEALYRDDPAAEDLLNEIKAARGK